MVSMSSIVILEGREWGPLREIRLDEPGTENLKNFAEQTKFFESALGQGANMNTANHDAETQFRCGHPISRKLKPLTSSANTTAKRVKS